MEEFKAIQTCLSRLEALDATNEAAGNADPSQVNVLLESLARLEHEHAQYKGATINTQRRQEEVLRETQDQVVQLGMRILKTEKESRGLKTGDHVAQIEARVQALEDQAKKTEGLKTSPAPRPPEDFYPNAVAHLERELVRVKWYFEGQISTLGQNMDALMAQLWEEHLRPRGVNPMEDLLGDTSPNPHGCSRQGQATSSCINNETDLVISIMRRLDTMKSQTIGYRPMMACHRGETETPMPITGIVGEPISFFFSRVSLNPGQLNISPSAKNCPETKPIMGPLRGFAFSEAPTPSGPPLSPVPVDVNRRRGGIPWYGPGVYNTMATPLLDYHALKDVQVWDVVPTWDGDGMKA